MESVRDVIYEAWFFRLSGSIAAKEKNGKRSFKAKGSWREKYFILVKLGDKLFLEWYDKKPVNANVQPKEQLSLWPTYRLSKCYVDRYVCTVLTPSHQIHVGATDQSSIDAFAFNCQTQTVLRENLEGVSFTVLPENTFEQERLGAVGSVCVLHVSPWGISVALQQSRSLIAHWPLRCIRSYESDSKGQFTFEAGKKSPFGEGTYTFQTRKAQDDELYNILENYVMQAASLADNYPHEPSDEDQREYDHLKRLTVVQPRPRESVRASMYASGLYDHIENDDPGVRDSVATSIPDVASHSIHVDHPNNRPAANRPEPLTLTSPPQRESNQSNLMNFGEYPQLISPTERRQVMIKPRTLIDKSIVVSQELPKPLHPSESDVNDYADPDEDLKMKKDRRPRPLPPSIPPPGPFSKPPVPQRFDSKVNAEFSYEDPRQMNVDVVEYEDPDVPPIPPPPVPKEIADVPRMPPPPVPVDLDMPVPLMPPPPVPGDPPMTTFSPVCHHHHPVQRENTYADASDMNPYMDPDMPAEPPPPVPRNAPPVPPFPSTLAGDVDSVNEYAEMSGSVPNVSHLASKEERVQPVEYEDPYADAKDLEAMRRPLVLKQPCDSVEYLGPDSNEYLGMDAVVGASVPKPQTLNKSGSVEYLEPDQPDEYLGMESLRTNVSQIQLRRSPTPTHGMDMNDSTGEEYMKMTDIRKSAPVTLSDGKMSIPSYAKSQSMFEINRDPHVVDIDIDGPGVPDIWVTPVKGGKDINRNTVTGDQFKTWSHRSRMPLPEPESYPPEDDDESGYLLLPPKLSRSRLQSQSCEELSGRQRQTQLDVTEPNEEGYFEIDDEGVVVADDVPMPFTGLLDMKNLKKAEKSPRGSQENILSQGQGGLSVPKAPRFKRSVSNPDVAGKGRKSHDKRDSEESPQKRQSKLSAFLYGTLHKKKSKSKLGGVGAEGDGSPGASPRSKPMKATSPQDQLLKPEYKSHKPEKADKHKRKLSGQAGSHKDIVGGIEITPKGKSFVKVKPKAGESSPQRGTSYPDRNLRTPSPNMGRRLPSLPSEIRDSDSLNVPRATVKHAQSQPNLL